MTRFSPYSYLFKFVRLFLLPATRHFPVFAMFCVSFSQQSTRTRLFDWTRCFFSKRFERTYCFACVYAFIAIHPFSRSFFIFFRVFFFPLQREDNSFRIAASVWITYMLAHWLKHLLTLQEVNTQQQ